MDKEFVDNLSKAVEKKEEYGELMNGICEYLNKVSPSDNKWYYNQMGFVLVDITKEEYDSYLEFIETLVGCNYTHLTTFKGLTLVMSINTLLEKNT